MKPEEWILLVRTLSIITAVIFLLSTTACTTYNGHPALIPLPCGKCTYVPQANKGVTVESVTVNGKGYQIIRPK